METCNWSRVLGDIGFTMFIFIPLPWFDIPEVITQPKIAILISYFISGMSGYFYLRVTLPIQTA
jgi:Na+/H+ antiporter NhaA